MRMFVGIYVFVVQMRWIAVFRIRIFRIMRIFRIGTMRCIVFTLTPVSGTGTGFGPLPSRERGIRLVGLSWCPHPVDTALKPV